MSIMESTFAPVDAPYIPGGGVLERRLRRFRARASGWIWWALGAVGCVVAGLVVLAVLVDQDPDTAVFVGLALAAPWPALAARSHRLAWHQRPDRVDDDMAVYAHAPVVTLDMRGSTSGGVRAGTRRLARLVPVGGVATERGALRLGDGTELRLEERLVAAHDPRTEVTEVEVRAVDQGGTPLVRAVGHHRGEWVDWTLDADQHALRLRQRLTAVPRRRTVLDAWGRAWLVTAVIGDDGARWQAELPEELDDLRRCFCLWMLAHLDGVGVVNAYPGVPGPSTWTPRPLRGAPGDGWAPVGQAVVRPERPKAHGYVDIG